MGTRRSPWSEQSIRVAGTRMLHLVRLRDRDRTSVSQRQVARWVSRLGRSERPTSSDVVSGLATEEVSRPEIDVLDPQPSHVHRAETGEYKNPHHRVVRGGIPDAWLPWRRSARPRRSGRRSPIPSAGRREACLQSAARFCIRCAGFEPSLRAVREVMRISRTVTRLCLGDTVTARTCLPVATRAEPFGSSPSSNKL